MFDAQLLLQYGHEDVDRDGNPYLRPDSVWRYPEERLDPEMLLYPFEEQFDLPAELVEFGQIQGREAEIVCEDGDASLFFLVEENNPSQFFRITFCRFVDGEHNRLVAPEPGGLVHGAGVKPPNLGIAFRHGDEKGHCKVYPVEPFEIQVPPVDKIEGTGLEDKLVQNVHVVDRSVRNAHKRWDRTPDVEEGMHFHGSLGFPEAGPREKAQAEVYCRRVESVDRILQFHPELLVRIKSSCFCNEELGELRIYPPVSALVGICERAPLHRAPYSHMVELSPCCVEAGLDIPEALPVGQLGKRHAIVLIEAAETPDTSIPFVLVDALLKLIEREEFHDLGENCFAAVHLPHFH